MKLLVISGSRADAGILEWPVHVLSGDNYFTVKILDIWNHGVETAHIETRAEFDRFRPDMVMVLGDRYEVLSAALAAHLNRIPIAHVGGGDVTQGSYDDAMRDCISRMASVHFCCSGPAFHRLLGLGYSNVHMVGSPGVDYIIHAADQWKRERPIAESYVVVSYQAETIDDTVDLDAVNKAIAGRKAIWITPNLDRGNDRIPKGESYSHEDFLNLLYHCEEFIGNSSAIFYEAPFLKPGGVPCKLIGKRQNGRIVPFADGLASERMRDILKGFRP